MVDIYNAWESGADTSDFICSTNCNAHYRLLVLKYWDHFGHSKVISNLHNIYFDIVKFIYINTIM